MREKRENFARACVGAAFASSSNTLEVPNAALEGASAETLEKTRNLLSVKAFFDSIPEIKNTLFTVNVCEAPPVEKWVWHAERPACVWTPSRVNQTLEKKRRFVALVERTEEARVFVRREGALYELCKSEYRRVGRVGCVAGDSVTLFY